MTPLRRALWRSVRCGVESVRISSDYELESTRSRQHSYAGVDFVSLRRVSHGSSRQAKAARFVRLLLHCLLRVLRGVGHVHPDNDLLYHAEGVQRGEVAPYREIWGCFETDERSDFGLTYSFFLRSAIRG